MVLRSVNLHILTALLFRIGIQPRSKTFNSSAFCQASFKTSYQLHTLTTSLYRIRIQPRSKTFNGSAFCQTPLRTSYQLHTLTTLLYRIIIQLSYQDSLTAPYHDTTSLRISYQLHTLTTSLSRITIQLCSALPLFTYVTTDSNGFIYTKSASSSKASIHIYKYPCESLGSVSPFDITTVYMKKYQGKHREFHSVSKFLEKKIGVSQISAVPYYQLSSVSIFIQLMCSSYRLYRNCQCSYISALASMGLIYTKFASSIKASILIYRYPCESHSSPDVFVLSMILPSHHALDVNSSSHPKKLFSDA